MADLPPNHVLGDKYVLLKKLAVGGMAEIYLAEQNGPGGFKKRLVIKRILEHLMGDGKFREMFQDEARLAAGLNHPNIVQIFELGDDNGTYYIAMEYVHGYNLRAVIQSCNEYGMWLAPEYIAKLGSQICEGLEYAHNFCDSDGKHLSIIHRDISPQNIILSNQGVIKLVDFGIAKAASNKVETQAGVIKGKLAYMSPEQVKGQKLDRRSDIFSLGIVLYELATHKRPFQGKSDLDILRAILEAKPTQLNHFRPDFPQELSNIIYRSLAKNRNERYSSTRDLQWDLERFIQSWRKPIGPYQLQQLVTRLEELDKTADANKNTPASPLPVAPPQPAPPQPAPPQAPPMSSDNYSYDDLDEDTIYSTKGQQSHANQVNQPIPYNSNNTPSPYQQPPAPGYPAPQRENAWLEASNDWDEDEGDRTVMNPSPVMSPNDFRRLARQNAPPIEDLVTVHEGSADAAQLNRSIENLSKGRMPGDGIDNYLKPLPSRLANGPATMLDSAIPNIPPPSYISAPKMQASERVVSHSNNRNSQQTPIDPTETVAVGALEVKVKQPKSKLPLLLLGLLLCLVSGGLIFYFLA